jgi:predicted TIM-barrel fold metal-dependent hydrolase
MTDNPGVTESCRIDVHYHILPPRYLAVEQIREPLTRAVTGVFGQPAAQQIVQGWTPAHALEELDRNGIATGFCSMSPFGTALGDVAQGRRVAREWNEDAAQLSRDYPGRFGLFATIPLTDVEGSLKEIEYAFDTLASDGVALITSYGTSWLGDPPFAPVFEELNRRKAVVFVHPTAPVCSCMMANVAPFVIEAPTDTTRAITNLVFTGALQRFPDIRFIFCHAGGTITAVAGRIGGFIDRRPDLAALAPQGFGAELGKLYYDIAGAADPAAMAALMALVPTAHILFGSDYPFVPIPITAGGLGQLGLAREELQAIECNNAQVLLRRLTKSGAGSC